MGRWPQPFWFLLWDAVAKEADFRELADFAKEDLGPFIGGGVSVSDKFLRERPDLLLQIFTRDLESASG